MPNNKVGLFRVAVGAVVINSDNQVLLTQRGHDREHHPGEWEILAGRLDQGECFEDAIKREAQEELGIELKIITILNTFHFFRGLAKEEHVGITYLARHAGGKVVVDGIEEVNYAWLTFGEAISLVKDQNIRENLHRAEMYLKNI